MEKQQNTSDHKLTKAQNQGVSSEQSLIPGAFLPSLHINLYNSYLIVSH